MFKSKDDLHERLEMLGFPVLETRSIQTANTTLAEVAESKDIRLWEGFPVMLANSLEKHWFSYNEAKGYLKSKKGISRLDLLIIMSLAVYEVMRLSLPGMEVLRNLFKTDKNQDFRYFLQKLEGNDDFVLFNKTMSGERIKSAFSTYYGGAQTGLRELLSVKDQHDLQYALSQFFPPRQKELVLKKLRNEKLTKTEREYYSRVVKKKVLALANPELQKLSQKLL
ncbi:MAG: hypothetical protein PHU49_12855 [Syntrophorhabdaceae bacterium]|nr:hypothetical protein [Syntrophorhabdaceae bacterium]MDD5244896.1 hypothetical protein [Syntrophorhabdaceae bacterium]